MRKSVIAKGLDGALEEKSVEAVEKPAVRPKTAGEMRAERWARETSAIGPETIMNYYTMYVNYYSGIVRMEQFAQTGIADRSGSNAARK